MEMLKNIKKALKEISLLLAQDEQLARLLYNDKSSALKEEGPSDWRSLIYDNYIRLTIPNETAIENTQQNTFIVLVLDTVSFNEEENSRANIFVYITTDANHILLDDNKNRLIEGADRIVSVLQSKKLSAAGQINVTSMNYVTFSDHRGGYQINLNLTDLQSGKVEL